MQNFLCIKFYLNLYRMRRYHLKREISTECLKSLAPYKVQWLHKCSPELTGEGDGKSPPSVNMKSPNHVSSLFWCGKTKGRTCTGVLVDNFTFLRGPAWAASLSVFTWGQGKHHPLTGHKRKARGVYTLTWSSHEHTALFIAQFNFSL